MMTGRREEQMNSHTQTQLLRFPWQLLCFAFVCNVACVFCVFLISLVSFSLLLTACLAVSLSAAAAAAGVESLRILRQSLTCLWRLPAFFF